MRSSEAQQLRWRCYLQALFGLLGDNTWSNCGGDPAAGVSRICCEAPGVTPFEMTRKALSLGPMNHIYWYGGCSIETLFLEGRTL
jgi:hypothetical protein